MDGKGQHGVDTAGAERGPERRDAVAGDGPEAGAGRAYVLCGAVDSAAVVGALGA